MQAEGRHGHRPRGWRFLALAGAAWGASAALYLLFAGQVSWHEALLALATASVLVAWAVALDRACRRGIAIGPGAWRAAARGLAALVPDAGRVCLVLLRVLLRGASASPGHLAGQDFRYGDDAADEAGRRGVVVLALSLAPNGFVLAPGSDALLLHRLAPAAPDPDREWPG